MKPNGQRRLTTPLGLVLLWMCLAAPLAQGALLDVWRASDLNFDDGDAVTTWSSASNRVAAATSAAEQPVFKKEVTPAGGPAVRFTGDRLGSPSPVGGRSAFSVALVFRADTAGVNDNAQWWGKSGIIDAEQGGVTSDWGIVLTESGQIGIGTGNTDLSTYSTGATLVGTNYQAAVLTWGGGRQAVYVHNRPPVSAAGASSAARNDAGITFGGIHTGEANRRFNGDLVEVWFYDAALTGEQATNVLLELYDVHLASNRPKIVSFSAATNQILLGEAVALSWTVTNALAISIDSGIGPVNAIGTTSVTPTNTTTYTLTASNQFGLRTAMVTVEVDPGIPVAHGMTTNVVKNTSLALVVRGTDPNGGALTYRVIDSPAHGVLAGTPPTLTYTPATDYLGLDSFSFVVNDGMFDSPTATVAIKVVPPPTAPTGIVLSTTNISSRAGPGSYLALLRALDINEDDTHTFELVPGFGNNSQFAIVGNQLYAGTSYAGGVGSTFSIRVRASDLTGFSVEQTLVLGVFDVRQNVVINEIHYNGPENRIREEFVELYNPTDTAIDISQWRVRGGIDFYIPDGTILGPNQFLVVAENPAVLAQRYGATAVGPWQGGLNNEGEEVTLRDAQGRLVDQVDYKVEFPWPIAADGDGASMQLVNASLDNNLGSSWRSGTPPTPGATNAVFASNAAPNIRQVEHSPQSPASTNPVVITCKVTDPEGVAGVQLHYQVVVPGNYIPAMLPLTATQLTGVTNRALLTNAPNPAFEAGTNWTTVAMNDDGLNGDAVAGDSVYSITLPPQGNRTLVRYRITVADGLGASRRAPFEDDPSLNFAYYVYDGIPAYEGISPAVLETLPVYTLITRAADIAQCTAWSSVGDQLQQYQNSNNTGPRNEGRLHFNWEGAMVYDGVVYDHITYRLRGANGRYHPGKRSFRFKFKPGNYLAAKDQEGKRFPTKWRELTTGKGQSNRGSETFALNEVVNMFLWNKMGVPAPQTLHFHFRVVRGANEAPNAYEGDFWGLSWAQEKYDVNFLEAHNLPKGNLYKLVDNFVLGTDERRYQGPYAVTNAEDFYNIENNLTGFKSTDWLLAHANYTNWYRYFTVAEAIRHYDTWPSANKNGAWYFEPIYTAANNYLGRMMQLPYDSTDTWGPTWNNGEDILFNGIFSSTATGGDTGQHPELQLEYRNVVREARDLLFQPDQINAIIDTFARRLKEFVVADLIRWSNAPSPANYKDMTAVGPALAQGVMGYAQDMKNFMFVGGNNAWWIDRSSIGAGGWITRLDTVAADTAIPQQPYVTYAGTNGYPVDGLIFRTSAFADPQGSNTFAAIQWRVAEIMLANELVAHPSQLKLEWDAAWDSGEITNFNEYVAVPAAALQPEHLYRIRVRHKDNTGRWSRWSAPLEFRPGAAELISALRANLVFSEIMYNPPGQGSIDGDEFEFLELKNIGPSTIDLSGLVFTSGISYTFPSGTTLASGAVYLLARNPAVLRTRYPNVVVRGTYTGKLNNDGEQLDISHPHAGVILSLTYGDRAPWPATPNGYGFSLVLADPARRTYGASATRYGSPGVDEAAFALGGVVINEVLSSSTLPVLDLVELVNISSSAVDISGWYLTDDPTYPWKFRIPAGTSLLPEAFYVVDETLFNPTPGIGTSFSFSSLGDDVYLFSANAAGELTGYSHGFSFGGAQDGVSFGRHVNTLGEEQFPLQTARTPGATNAGPRSGAVVISEIHYNAPVTADEFVELRNNTTSDQPLFDPAAPTNTWRISGLGYTFPSNTVLAAHGYLLLVDDDPAAFRARHVVPANVPVFQYTGSLQDSGENLEIQAPDAPTASGVPYYAVDTVRYNDRAPWPLAADGAGASLHRIDAGTYANDPVAWRASTPTPSLAPGAGTPPMVASQSFSRMVIATTTTSLEVSASGSEPLFYQWRRNGSNLAGATNASLTLTNAQLGTAGTYSVVVYNAAGATESQPILIVVRAGPTILEQPVVQSVRPGNNATFRVSAYSTALPLTYQWRFNGVSILNATNPTLNLTSIQLAQQGAYDVVVTDGVGSIESQPAQLRLLIEPWVVQQPPHSIIPVGETLALPVTITNTATLPIQFRWRKTAVSFLTNVMYELQDTLVLDNVSLANAGTYTVVAINDARLSGVGSSNALVTVVEPPRHQVVTEGESATFSVQVGNPGRLNQPARLDIEWLFNGAEITSALTNAMVSSVNYTNSGVLVTSNVLMLSNVRQANLGSYGVRVTVITNLGPNITIPPALFTATLSFGAVDTDGDLMPDEWENLYSCLNRTVADANADPDNDHMSNLVEYYAGTDPCDGQSYLKVEMVRAGGAGGTNVVLRFGAVANKSYSVQYTDQLGTNWLRLADVAEQLTNRVETVVDPGWTSKRFYRLVTPRQP